TYGGGQYSARPLWGGAGLSLAGSAVEADIWLYAVGDHGPAFIEPPMKKTVFPTFIRMGCQAFARDWRAGELRLLLLALMTAAAAITSVVFLADRTGQLQ